MLNLDRDAAIDLLNKAVEHKGADHVQAICANVEYDAETAQPVPGCLVGTALFLGGISLRDLEDTDGSVHVTLPKLRERGLLSYNFDAEQVLYGAQSAQDGNGSALPGTSDDALIKDYNKKPWGQAVEEAVVRF